jgi:hypothetical protein
MHVTIHYYLIFNDPKWNISQRTRDIYLSTYMITYNIVVYEITYTIT